jgi:hypothetical protein
LGEHGFRYFSSAPVMPESIDADQYKALSQYRGRLGQLGLYSKYESLADFRDQLQRHLAGQMIELLKQNPSASSGGETPSEKGTDQQQAIVTFCADFEAFLRRLSAEWEAERDSNPHNTDDGKYIMNRAADEVLHFKSMITEDSSGLSQQLGEVLKRIRAHQRHQSYIDGGVSFRGFWTEGDEIIGVLRDEAAKLRGLINDWQLNA